MMRKKLTLLSLIMLLGLTFSCAQGQKAGESNPAAAGVQLPLYTAYNLWYEKPDHLYSVNYKRGTLIPAGTRLTAVTPGKSLRRQGKITLTKANGETFVVYFQAKFHPGLTAESFKDRLVTTKNFEALTAGMTGKEIEGIRKGAIQPGMSKQAVLVTLGYPPEHVTPSLESNTWMYWDNRFNRRAVRFDESGRVGSVVQ